MHGVMMRASEVNWKDTQSVANFVLWCTANDCMQHFYRTWPWRKVRAQVLALDHYECQHCRAKGRYTKASVAHHVNYLKARPDLALTIWHERNDGQRSRNLIALCTACHEAEHNRIETMLAARHGTRPPVTPERW